MNMEKEEMDFLGLNAIKLPNNKLKVLPSSSKLLIISKGKIQVIFSEIDENQEPIGRQFPIFEFEKGNVVFGLDTKILNGNYGFFVAGMPECEIVEIDLDKYKKIVSGNENEVFKTTLWPWIEATEKLLFEDNPNQLNAHDINESGTYKFENETVITPRIKNAITVNSGVISLTNENSLSLSKGDEFLFTPGAIFKTSKDSEIIISSFEQSSISSSVWNFCDKITHIAPQLIFQKCIIKTANDENKAFFDRHKEILQSRSNALLRLVSIIKKDRFVLFNFSSEDLLFSACEIIGNFLKVKFSIPSVLKKNGDIFGNVKAIAEKSNIKSRYIRLEENEWWEKDSGPFLGFYAEDKSPVALIPVKGGGYDICNPKDKSIKRVTSKNAKILSTDAFAFYRPFPDGEIGIVKLLRFLFQGTSGDLMCIAGVGLLISLIGSFFPIATGVIFNDIIPLADKGLLYQVAIILVVCALTNWSFDVVQSIAILRIQGSSNYAGQAAVWDRLLSLPATFFQKYSSGDLATRSMGISYIREIFSLALLKDVAAGIFSFFSLILMFYYAAELAKWGVVFTILVCLIFTISGTYFYLTQKKLMDLEGYIANLLLQFISGIAKIKISNAEDKALSIWAEKFQEKRLLSKKASLLQNAISSICTALQILIMMIFFGLIVEKITISNVTVGNFLAFIAAYTNFYMSMGALFSSVVQVLAGGPVYKRLKPILTTPVEVNKEQSELDEFSGNIEISNLTFKYSDDGPTIINNISISIKAGEYVAIVGESGSGKSTLLRLLLGFEFAQSGGIYYDNKDITELNIKSLRRQIGIVLQNSKLIQGSILQNIIGTSPILTIDDAWKAARMAGCENDIKQMPMQMFTMVAPGGSTFSGGQCQKIAIARALVRNPKVLFFDEATSALDNITQSMVSKCLDSLNVTRVVIAHRLSTIRNADKIYVIKQGDLVESGNFDELMNKKGYFYILAKRQLVEKNTEESNT